MDLNYSVCHICSTIFVGWNTSRHDYWFDIAMFTYFLSMFIYFFNYSHKLKHNISLWSHPDITFVSFVGRPSNYGWNCYIRFCYSLLQPETCSTTGIFWSSLLVLQALYASQSYFVQVKILIKVPAEFLIRHLQKCCYHFFAYSFLIFCALNVHQVAY